MDFTDQEVNKLRQSFTERLTQFEKETNKKVKELDFTVKNSTS